MRFAIAGCAGRMGRLLLSEVLASGHTLVAGSVSAQSALVGTDLGDIVGPTRVGVSATTDAARLFEADVVIDFTNPAATRTHAELAALKGKPIVIGTTGLDSQTERVVLAASEVVPVLRAANFSRGVALLELLVAQAASTLGREADIEIVEMHHRAKADAPSGTALTLGRAAAVARGQDIDVVGARCRVDRRVPGSIGFAALRGGSVVGDHTVICALDGERIELTHKAESRTIYAKGAVEAALWLTQQPPGLYSMRDFSAAQQKRA